MVKVIGVQVDKFNSTAILIFAWEVALFGINFDKGAKVSSLHIAVSVVLAIAILWLLVRLGISRYSAWHDPQMVEVPSSRLVRGLGSLCSNKAVQEILCWMPPMIPEERFKGKDVNEGICGEIRRTPAEARAIHAEKNRQSLVLSLLVAFYVFGLIAAAPIVAMTYIKTLA